MGKKDATSRKKEEGFTREDPQPSSSSSFSKPVADGNTSHNPALNTPVRIRMNKAARAFLNRVAEDCTFPEDFRDRVRPWTGQDAAPWDLLDEACSRAAASPSFKGSPAPSLSQLVFEGGIDLREPPPRVRSKELEERLARLQRELDERTYKEMVKGVTRREDEARDQEEAAFRTYKDQLGFGLNVVFTMFTLFVFCYYMARALTNNEALRLLAGLLGAIFAMLMETTLLITRTSYTLKDRINFTKKYF